MSALGDYVHYRAANYRKYGINKRQTDQTRAWSGTLMGWRQKRSAGYEKINYSGLKRELMNNTLAQIQMDGKLLNLDFANRIRQFEDIVLKRLDQEGKTPEYSKPLKTNFTPEQLMSTKQNFIELQKEINYINGKGLVLGKTTSRDEIERIEKRYSQLRRLGGGQKSILGGIQQGYNDHAAKTWRNTLENQLGSIIDETIKDSAEEALNKAIEQEMLSGITGIVQIKKGEKSTTVKSITDETQSIYNINATEDNWAFEFIANRTNMLEGIKGEISSLYWTNTNPSVSIKGDKISLGKLLQIVQTEDDFGTHWLNMHIVGRNFNTYDIDKDLATTAVYISLSQGKSTKETNGDFVFIDRNTGIIRQLGFWQMIKQREDVGLRNTISGYKIPNKWVGKEHNYGKAFQRIASILSNAHTVQLSAAYESIKSEQFNVI